VKRFLILFKSAVNLLHSLNKINFTIFRMHSKSKGEQETRRRLGLAATVCSILHTLPFTWNSKRQLLEPLSPRRYILFQICCLLDFVHRMTRTITYFWYLYNDRLTANQIVWGCMMALTFSTSYILLFNTIVNHKPFLKWLNALIGLGGTLEGTHEIQTKLLVIPAAVLKLFNF